MRHGEHANMKKFTVRFLPLGETIETRPGDNLLEKAMEAGVYLQAACGGEGACGKCRVQIVAGKVDSKAGAQLAPEDAAAGFCLACQSAVRGDLEVLIPPESHLGLETAPAARRARGAGISQEVEALASTSWYGPLLRKYAVALEPPTLDDNASDLARLFRALKKQHGLERISADLGLLRRLSRLLRAAGWRITVTLEQPPDGQTGTGCTLVQAEPGDTTAHQYAIALDVGTTSLWGQLIDLQSRQVLAESSGYNPQIRCGDDVISRIIYAQKPGGLDGLQAAAVEGLNAVIDELLPKAGVNREDVSYVTAAGNTVMTHLLLGLDPKYIRESPYIPAATTFPPLPAAQLGLAVGEHARLYALPLVASYIGGDIVSGVLGCGMFRRTQLTLYIDIGTNGEIVVGNQDWLMTASCSAGPAFEGGGLRCGMRAAAGAVEGFAIHPTTWEPMLVTVGRVRPRGICGSGAINILAEFFKKGVIDQKGRYRRRDATDRIRQGPDGMEFVLARAELSATGQDIVLTEADIDNLIRAKAAMFAGYQCLLDKVNLRFADLEQVIIAGAFGDFIDLEHAITIGLLPDIPIERFCFIGNGSLLGARLVSFSARLLDQAELIARSMTNIELSEDRAFMDRYVAGMFLPHTDGRLFPTVSGRLGRCASPGS